MNKKIKKILSNLIPKSLKYSSFLNEALLVFSYLMTYSLKKNKKRILTGDNYSITKGISNFEMLPDYKIKTEKIVKDEFGFLIKENRFLRKKYTHFTQVDWIANELSLDIKKIMFPYKILGKDNKYIFFSIGKKLYRTVDSFTSHTYITKLAFLPAKNMQMQVTKFGYFIVGQRSIYFSRDLIRWEKSLSVKSNGIKDTFTSYYCFDKDLCYIYFAEYSCNENNTHSLYRSVLNESRQFTWEKILEFDSIRDFKNKDENSAIITARHFHIVKCDPYTGYLWVGVGDTNEHSKILVSKNFGNDFHLIGTGSQEWRTLSFWFTEKYTYWNMDSHESQKVFRIQREEVYKNVSERNKLVNILSYKQALILTLESEKLKEEVLNLANGALFNSIEYSSQNHGKWIIMAGSPEGHIRDMNGRVFAIKETNEKVNAFEIILVQPKNPNAHYSKNMFTLLIPEVVDKDGFIFFSTRNLKINGLVKANLNLTSKVFKYE